LKNQFQTLGEDDIEFLDSVLEQTRNQEAEVKKETREQLEAFRKQQEEAEKAAKQADGPDGAVDAVDATWTVGPRKRKKGKEKEGLPGVKLRKTSTADGPSEEPRAVLSKTDTVEAKSATSTNPSGLEQEQAAPNTKPEVGERSKEPTSIQKPSPPAAALGLGAYSSDEDD
jgi:hypothetical protein